MTTWTVRDILDATGGSLVRGHPEGRLSGLSIDSRSLLEGEGFVAIRGKRLDGHRFLEAAAHSCAILSAVNPDDFASRFGYHARTGDFTEGLAWLLAADRWRTQGAQGQAHMRETFEITKAMDQHVAAYERLLVSGRRGGGARAVPQA